MALTNSLLSFAIGNNSFSGTPNENRVISLLLKLEYTFEINASTPIGSIPPEGLLTEGTDKKAG